MCRYTLRDLTGTGNPENASSPPRQPLELRAGDRERLGERHGRLEMKLLLPTWASDKNWPAAKSLIGPSESWLGMPGIRRVTGYKVVELARRRVLGNKAANGNAGSTEHAYGSRSW